MAAEVTRPVAQASFWMSIIAFILIDSAARGQIYRWPIADWLASTVLLIGGGAGLLGLVYLGLSFRRRRRPDRTSWVFLGISAILLAVSAVRFVRFLI